MFWLLYLFIYFQNKKGLYDPLWWVFDHLSLKTKQQGNALFALIFLKIKLSTSIAGKKKRVRYLIIKSEIVFVKTKQQKMHQKNKKQ